MSTGQRESVEDFVSNMEQDLPEDYTLYLVDKHIIKAAEGLESCGHEPRDAEAMLYCFEGAYDAFEGYHWTSSIIVHPETFEELGTAIYAEDRVVGSAILIAVAK